MRSCWRLLFWSRSARSRSYQGIAAGVAMDRTGIISLDDTLMIADGRVLRGLLRVKENSPLETGVGEPEVYAPGIGLVLDGSLRLAGVRRAPGDVIDRREP